MARSVLFIHPDNPEKRLIQQAAHVLQAGGVAIYPTDSSYAIGCAVGEKSAMDRIRQMRQLDKTHHFTLMCRDLSELASYARVDNWAFRLLKAYTPGPYTFILQATGEVPRRLMHPKRKTIGLRVPDNAICQSLLQALAVPMLTTSLQLPGDEVPLSDPDEFTASLSRQVDVILHAGIGGLEPTTVVDLSHKAAVLLREGKGESAAFVKE